MRRSTTAGLWLVPTLFFATACHAQDDTAQIGGVWQNEAGSVVTFEADEDGRLSGRYCSELGQADPDSCDPLTGWVAGDVVGFTVLFDPPGSVTAWSGQVGTDEEGDYLRTLWHLSRDVSEDDEPDRLWESVISGFATFRPVEASDDPSLEE